MAVDYQDLFGNIGSVIKAVNEAEFELESLDYDLSLIQDSLEASEQQTALAPALQIVTSAQQSLVNYRQSLGQIVDLRLQDYTTVISQLNLATNSVTEVLKSIISDMSVNSESVDASTVTIGSVTAASGNVGNGIILIDATLDGYSAPISGGFAHPDYAGVLSQLAVNETFVLTVTADSYASGRTSGQESLSWNGGIALSSAWANGSEGSGSGPGISTLNAGTIISNGTMEAFSTTDTPDGWSIAAGSVSTNVARDAVNFYRGTYAVKLIGNSSVATIRIEQSISISRVKPLRRYCCSIRYKSSATEGAGGKIFSVQLTGTGYSAGSTEKISIAGGSLATSWTLAYFYVTLPQTIPSDLALAIQFSGTPTVTISVDDVTFDSVTYFGGLSAVAIAGSTPFAVGDSWTSAIVNDQEGTIQEWFRRNYKCQLPSSATGAETLSDSLAE